MSFFRNATLFFLVAAGGAGAYAWYTKKTYGEALDHSRSAETSCKTQLEGALDASTSERAAREAAEKLAADQLDASRAELADLRSQQEEIQKRLASFRALTEKFRKMIDSGKLQVILRHGRMVVKLPAGVLFDSGSAELSKEGKDSLREVAGVLKTMDRHFMVAGHTDNQPVIGGDAGAKNNLELSTSRALTVAQFLIASGMNPSRLVAAGYAEHEPVRENTTEPGRRENRRIEIVLLPNVTELPLDGVLDAGARPSPR
jgi:chemotaxis protein MotB